MLQISDRKVDLNVDRKWTNKHVKHSTKNKTTAVEAEGTPLVPRSCFRGRSGIPKSKSVIFLVYFCLFTNDRQNTEAQPLVSPLVLHSPDVVQLGNKSLLSRLSLLPPAVCRFYWVRQRLTKSIAVRIGILPHTRETPLHKAGLSQGHQRRGRNRSNDHWRFCSFFILCVRKVAWPLDRPLSRGNEGRLTLVEYMRLDFPGKALCRRK